MDGALVPVWACVGLLTGAALAIPTRKLLVSRSTEVFPLKWVPSTITAVAFAILAWRLGDRFDLLPFSALAAGGVALGTVDVLERRLPSRLLLPVAVAVGSLLLVSTAVHGKMSSLLQALAGMAVVAVVYLAIALVTGGELGAGDVKLGGLLGLALGWLGWPELFAGTVLGWFVAAFSWLVLRTTGRLTRDATLPMGPSLLLGAFVAVCLSAMPDARYL
ncbi:A24 family peptidase [Lentzea alba]|uniref:prepilin peptidase n=1 Tax=Lentzea alba TaxID=2714351 RepID=UPI0039BFE6C1